MKRTVVVLSLLLGLTSGPTWSADAPSDPLNNWPQWRGPQATGVAPLGDPPVEWSEEKNVRWKVPIPGKGHASPVVWGDLLFVATAIPVGEEKAPEPKPTGGRRRGPMGLSPTRVNQFVLLALNRDDGSVAWRRTVREELPHEGTHPDGSWASSSPVTDGEHVFAYFGSRGLYAFDMEGSLLWEKDLGDMNVRLGFGEGSSPTLYGDRLILVWDHEGQSFVTALDKKTGRELWKVDRDEATSWATPLVVEHDGGAQIVTSATGRIRSYELESGDLLWQAKGMTFNAIPSPVAARGTVYLMSGFRGNSLMAIRLDQARGDVTDSEAVVWRHDRDTPYVPSPVLYEKNLYFLKSNAALVSSFDIETGEAHFGPQRLEGIRGVYASPVAANGRIYFLGRQGNAVVLEHGSQFKVLARNSLDDRFDASPAIVGKNLYLRGHSYVYALGGE